VSCNPSCIDKSRRA